MAHHSFSGNAVQTLNRAGNIVLDAVLPPRCAGCRSWEHELFCARCRAHLHSITMPFCARCGAPFDRLAQAADICAQCRPNCHHAAPPFEISRSVYEFRGPLRKAVHRFKYEGKTALAKPLARLLHDFLQHQLSVAPMIPHHQLALMVPVPMHSWRRYRRGYNQSTLLARALGESLGIPCVEILQRARYTTAQVGLSATQRGDNVRGAFSWNQKMARGAKIPDGPILLIDDVYTTGATIAECARVLKQNGRREVYVLTLARQTHGGAGTSSFQKN